MTLAPLPKLFTGEARAAGAPPAMDWLALKDLRIDEDYQRPVSRSGFANVQAIARAFEWRKFAPVIVAPLAGGLHAIIDGQHRCLAALACGYDKVPCYIVKAAPSEAAAIFAAVNGQVTPMSALSVFKAARASQAPWAVAVDAACAAAGVTALAYPLSVNRQKPHMTVAAGTMRKMVERVGRLPLACALRALVAMAGSDAPGFLTSTRISTWTGVFAARPGWVQEPDAVIAAFAGLDPVRLSDEALLAEVVRRVGNGQISAEAQAAIRDKVLDLKARKFSPQMISSSLRLPYAEVQRHLGARP